MPGGLYKYLEPVCAKWTAFHPPTPFPFECLPSARSEKEALLCFVCPSAPTSHFLPVNCQCSKAEHWKPHVKQRLVVSQCRLKSPRRIFFLCSLGTQEDKHLNCHYSTLEICAWKNNSYFGPFFKLKEKVKCCIKHSLTAFLNGLYWHFNLLLSL